MVAITPISKMLNLVITPVSKMLNLTKYELAIAWSNDPRRPTLWV